MRKELVRLKKRMTEIQTDRNNQKKVVKQTDRQTNGQKERQRGKKTDIYRQG